MQDIQSEKEKLLVIINDNKEVSKETVKKLAKNDEIVRKYQEWKFSGDSSDNEKLYHLLTKGMADEKKESGDYKIAIQLYTDILMDQPPHIDTLYSRAMCYIHTAQYSLCIEVEELMHTHYTW